MNAETPTMKMCVVQTDIYNNNPRVIARFLYPSDALQYIQLTKDLFKLYVQDFNTLLPWDESPENPDLTLLSPEL